ncbi:MAG: hypothetical protein K2K02_07045 [Ruminococcus sp.]|nr:hypothetical protein [Ruminococcus sp.]
MSELSFRYCPLCSEKLVSGKLMIPEGHSIKKYVWWYSEKSVFVKRLNQCIGLFKTIPVEYNKKTSGKLNIPAGYCKKCDRIIAEFESGE